MEAYDFEMSGRAPEVADDTVAETSFTDASATGAWGGVLPDPPALTPGQAGDNIQNLRDEMRASELDDQKKRLVEAYYHWVGSEYKLAPAEIPYDQFSIGEDGKTLYWTPGGGREIPVVAIRGGGGFLALSTLVQKYGAGGTNAVRTSLGLQKFGSKTRRVALSPHGEKTLQDALNSIPPGGEDVPVQEVADAAVAGAERAAAILTREQDAALETIDDPPMNTEWVTQTARELGGLRLAMTRKRDELVNNNGKLTELDQRIDKKEDHLARERTKLTETDDEDLQREIRKKIADLERELSDMRLERAARLEALSAIKEVLRTQISRVRETINRILHEDKTLAERIRTLFREQGITIASILTAIGMTISTLVLALTGGGGGAAPTPPPSPPDKGGLREWAKKTLRALGRVLAKLAGKAAAALPGVIGSVVSWVLGLLAKTTSWLATNLWALVVAVGGLLLVAAREWLSKTPKRE